MWTERSEADVSNSVRRFRLGKVLAGATCGVAMAITLGAIVAVFTLDDNAPDSAPESLAAAAADQVAHKVLADEWNDRISKDGFWRGRSNSSSSSAGNNRGQRTRPSQLQGPPQPPNWFVTPPPVGSWWADPRSSNGQSQNGNSGKAKAVSGNRTVCVRMCDGFFFPVSFGGAENSSRDQATCTNTCPGARLYHYKPGSEDPEDMVDANGQPYSKMKNANLFRTQYVESCKCKPHPWEKDATDRHRIYALEDLRRKGNRAVVAELDELKSRNRLIDYTVNRRRPVRGNGKKEEALDKPGSEQQVAQSSAPRSDANRGQGGDRGSQSIVTGSVATAASAATVQSLATAAAAVQSPNPRAAAVTPVAARSSVDLAGEQPAPYVVNLPDWSQADGAAAAPETVPAEVAPATPIVAKANQGRSASRRSRPSNSNSTAARPGDMMRLGAVQPEPRRAPIATQRRSDWTRAVFGQ